MADRETLFQRICHDAVVACGTDREAIERYVREHVEAMDETDRACVKRDVDRVLAFQAPNPAAKVN